MESSVVVNLFPLLATLSLAALITYYFLIYPFLLSPLRAVPRAHWSVPLPYLGKLWVLCQRYRARNNAATYTAHLKHGPVVRLADDEISVNCYEGGIKTIYSGGWEKHEWYPRQFANFGVMNMFSTVGHTPHAQKKRIMANIYSKSYLASSPQVQANSQELLSKRFLPLLQSLANSGEPFDIHEINNAFTMDFMTAYQFGITNSSNFTQNVEVRRKYLRLYHSRRDWQFISSEVSPMVRKLLTKLGISFYPEFVHGANAWLENWSREMCDAADQYLKRMHDSSTSTNPGDEPLVFKQYRTGLLSSRQKDPTAGLEVHPHLDEGLNFTGYKNAARSVPDEQTTTLEVYSDMVDQLAAGHETSGVALTYFYYELSKNQALQDRLYKEIRTLEPQISWPPPSTSDTEDSLLDLPSTKSIDSLPLLQATLQETLRLHAPIPGMQPRISPITSDGRGVTLGPDPQGGKHHYSHLPPNIRVSAMAYTLHRISHIFPQPESFLPERWLLKSQYPDLSSTSTDEQLIEMSRHFWAFGSGGRMCIGRHLAVQEMKVVICAVLGNWRVVPVEGGDEGIEELDAYTTRPRGGRLVVKLVRR